MTVRLLPTGYPENRDPSNIKAWADYHNHTLIGGFIRKHADLLIEISGRCPGVVQAMPMTEVAKLLDELAWEIEGRTLHQRLAGWDSEQVTHQLLSKCFNGE